MAEQWDLVITDFNMPGRSGLDAIKQIRLSHPHLPVLMMSMYSESQFGIRAIRAGASGYLGKDHIHEELPAAVKMLLQGRKYITPVIAEQLADAVHAPANGKPHEKLSDREFEVFKLLAEGNTIADIAERLLISPTTVSTFRSRIMEKMKMKSNAEIARYAVEEKII
ncbi:MAG: response regulator transcription factor, partial [Bacteroidota bacterium]